MFARARSVVGLGLVAFFACKDEFEDECASFCPADPAVCPQGEVDCTKNCADQARSADSFGCRAESVVYSKCVAAEDLCATEAPEPCREEYDALYTCLLCAQTPGDPACDSGTTSATTTATLSASTTTTAGSTTSSTSQSLSSTGGGQGGLGGGGGS